MSRDRYERRHRRTHRHPEVIRMMAGANIPDNAPSAEEMRRVLLDIDHMAVQCLQDDTGSSFDRARRARGMMMSIRDEISAALRRREDA
jgi:hypothetical protein